MNYTLGMFTFQVCDLRDSFTHIYKLYTDKQWTLQNTDKSVGQETQTWRNLKIIKCYLVNASLYFSTFFFFKVPLHMLHTLWEVDGQLKHMEQCV